jgi:hypothetical protein
MTYSSPSPIPVNKFADFEALNRIIKSMNDLYSEVPDVMLRTSSQTYKNKYHPMRVIGGKVSFGTMASGTEKNLEVTLPGLSVSPGPIIVVSPANSSISLRWNHSLTSNGFRIRVRADTSLEGLWMHWIAIYVGTG